ncbi:MAG: formylglycine-generating enzyme family protein [Planctomycetes bacterium]|nr:formylglycine-generating enzyme family protein [Planctomycetota bacterium]
MKIFSRFLFLSCFSLILFSHSVFAVKSATYTEPNTGVKLMFLKGGCYQMGDVFGIGESDETPPHNVCVNDFYLGIFEVTVGQYKEFVKETGYITDMERVKGCVSTEFVEGDANQKKINSWVNPGFTQGDEHPVVMVSWNDATAYIKWLTRKSGLGFRLPTEAEWEYAVRNGGKMHKYSWGMGRPSGNVADRTGNKEFPDWSIWNGYDDGYVFTAPVGAFKANSFGIHDMSGNVWEWVLDWYSPDYYKNSQTQNPQGPSTGKRRVLKGGSWMSSPKNLRATNRYMNSPDICTNFMGFRVAISVK